MIRTHKKEIAIGLLVTIILIWVTFIDLSRPDPRPQILYNRLYYSGVDVEGVTFTRTENGCIYKASRAINYKGKLVEYWKITFSAGNTPLYWIRPAEFKGPADISAGPLPV